jgi:protein-glutamine gamma-glutamyltransferase
VTTSAERRVRGWLAVAAVLAQLAAAGAGLMSGATLVLVAGASGASPWVVAKPSARSTRVGYVLAAAVAMNAVRELLARPTAVTHAGISASLSTLTLTLVLLMVVLAPTWRRPRDHRLWLAMSAAVAVAACATGSGRAEAFVLVVSWLVLLIAAGVVQVSSLSATADVVAETDALPKAQRPIALLRFASVAMPVGVGVLIFALLPGGLGGGALPTKLAHFVNAPAGYVPTRGQLGVDTMGNGELDLRARGALPTTPLLLVPPDAPPLWRGSVYRDYSGQDWRAAAPDDSTIHRLVRGTDVTLPRAEEDPLPTGVTRTDVVRLEPSTHALLAWAPGVIQRVQADMFGAVRDGGAVRIFGSRAASGYTVTSDVASTAPWLLRRASGADNVDSSWTALPGELPQRVTDLAHRVTAAAPTRFEQVQAIQAYLRTHETYALNSPVPGPGEDAVDRFLFRDHVGFCEQFASAEAVMLRTLGVPARVVSGLAYGHAQQGGVLFTAGDAHAWVEVYYAGVGWSPSDPTAGVRLAASTKHRGGVLASLRRSLGNASIPAAAGALVLFAVAAFLFGRRRKVRRSAATPQVLRAFLRFVRRSRRSRDHAETAREYLARYDAGEALVAALVALEAECYGARGLDPNEAEHAERVFANAARRGKRPGIGSRGSTR